MSPKTQSANSILKLQVRSNFVAIRSFEYHHGVILFKAAYRLVHLRPLESATIGKFKPKPHLVALDLDHREDDVVAEDDAFALPAWYDDHG